MLSKFTQAIKDYMARSYEVENLDEFFTFVEDNAQEFAEDFVDTVFDSETWAQSQEETCNKCDEVESECTCDECEDCGNTFCTCI